MSNQVNVPQDKLDALLGIAGKQLGKDPQQLRQELESGNLNNVLNGMNEKTANQVNQVLNNPEALNAMLANDKIKKLIDGLMGGKK